MKHLTTLLSLLLSCTTLAQGPVEFPWNPDSDGDDFIGVNDLMALLGEFDSVFSEEALYLSEDSLSAMYNAGDKSFLECQIACQNLPGRWRMPKYEDVSVSGQEMWLWHEGYPLVGPSSKVVLLTENGGLSDGSNMQYAQPCFCVTKQRPKVEYSYCDGGDPSGAGFTQCINEKLAEGWYPLSGFPNHHDEQGWTTENGVFPNQTHFTKHTFASFWRWAE